MSMPENNLRRIQMPNCKRCANRDIRRQHSEEGLCNHNKSGVDDLPIRCMGEWAHEKIHYLVRYFEIFAKGMHNKWNNNIRYIELCCGPGRCSTRNGFEQDGTSLAILLNPAFKYMHDAVFVDNNKNVVDVLNQRIAALNKNDVARAVLGDYHNPDSIINALRAKPFNGITLCLVDPTECDIPFRTINLLAKEGGSKVDFIISFFAKNDFHRNCVETTIKPGFSRARKKYGEFIGCSDFFTRDAVKKAASSGNRKNITSLFINEYKSSLSLIDKKSQDSVEIGGFYQLLFATSHPRGLDFWKKAKMIDPHGQSSLPGFD